jgi:hypothetical protein
MEHNAPETGEAVNVTTLNAADRCDRCGAQAYVRTAHEQPDERVLYLLWCAHHFRHTKDNAEGVDILSPYVVANHLERLEPAKEAAPA